VVLPLTCRPLRLGPVLSLRLLLSHRVLAARTLGGGNLPAETSMDRDLGEAGAEPIHVNPAGDPRHTARARELPDRVAVTGPVGGGNARPRDAVRGDPERILRLGELERVAGRGPARRVGVDHRLPAEPPVHPLDPD